MWGRDSLFVTKHKTRYRASESLVNSQVRRGVLSTQPVIKEASAHAATDIATLLNALYASEGADSQLRAADIETMLACPSPRLKIALAYDDGSPIGAILYYDGFDVQSVTRGYHVADMVVAASHRRRAIGKKLLQYAANECLSTGGAWMSLTCLKENLVGNKFYQALGFQIVSVQFYAIGANGLASLLNDS